MLKFIKNRTSAYTVCPIFITSPLLYSIRLKKYVTKAYEKEKDTVHLGILFNANYLLLVFNFFFLGESMSPSPSPISRKSRSPSSISTAIVTATKATPEVDSVIFLINARTHIVPSNML